MKHTNLELEPLFEKNEQDQIIRDTEVTLQQTWQAMEKLVDDGLVKSIGVCNYPIVLLYDLMNYARIKPVCNQVEVHPYLTQKSLIKICHETLNIQVVAYRPLAYGPRGSLLQDAVVQELAEKYSKTPAQIVLRWALHHNLVVIPKSISKQHLKENADIVNFSLDQQEVEKLDSLNRNLRMCNPENSKWNLHIFD
jgi:diketogulonate reductase-like aldo/keto reductase